MSNYSKVSLIFYLKIQQKTQPNLTEILIILEGNQRFWQERFFASVLHPYIRNLVKILVRYFTTSEKYIRPAGRIFWQVGLGDQRQNERQKRRDT